MRNLKALLKSNKLIYSAYSNLQGLRVAITEGSWRMVFQLKKWHQSEQKNHYLRWPGGEAWCSENTKLNQFLVDSGLNFSEGSHTYYLPPQKNLRRLLGEMVDVYPSNSGFKILKDPGNPLEAEYMGNHEDGRSADKVRRLLTGRPHQQMIVANYIHYQGLGPKIYDVCCIERGEQRHTIFVVDHVFGRSPSMTECREFIRILKTVLKKSLLSMSIRNWENGGDFKCPSCNGNLFISKGVEGVFYQYVDFQNFALESPQAWSRTIIKNNDKKFHFGNKREWRKGSYLYQSVPGFGASAKRNTDKRWNKILDVLNENSISLSKRMVLDVGCNSGMMIAASLKKGALWGVGWDTQETSKVARLLLDSMGASRSTLVGANLSSSYDLEKDIPKNLLKFLNGAIIFYLAIQHHIGLIKSLPSIPWHVFVYEGAQKETIEQSKKLLSNLLVEGVSVMSSSYITDGDSSKRPLLIMKKIQEPE